MLLLILIFETTLSFGSQQTIQPVILSKRAINTTIDNVQDLLQAYDLTMPIVTNIYQMEKQNLSEASLSQSYWSSHSLALYRGGSANRFNHPEFAEQNNWQKRYESYLEHPVETFIHNQSIQMLSPLEKYELVIDSNFHSLSLNEWIKGRDYTDSFGTIPSWVGACHGTAPSALRHSRPAHAITVLSADGKHHIVFYPSDIKALLAHAWATNGGPSAVMGSRCQQIKGSCKDTNPGSFHLALTNLIGLNNKPIIIDTDSGPQVWNRPVISYKLKYFNPQFRYYTRGVSRAVILADQYQNDPYRSQRAIDTKKLVGVRAEIEVITDTLPSTDITDTPKNDKTFKIVLTYDLELDSNGEILGGVWHQANFPDFVWIVSNTNTPLSFHERMITKTGLVSTKKASLPIVLQQIAIESAKADQVSYWTIEYLLNLSQTLTTGNDP